MQQDFFTDICKTLSLGKLKAPVTAVSGGYMHKMYRMETAQGTYAVKLLNPSVMQRPDVFCNLHLAESLEQELQNAHIPIVPANIYNGEKMQCLQNQYFYVFDWLDGTMVQSNRSTVKLWVAFWHGFIKFPVTCLFRRQKSRL